MKGDKERREFYNFRILGLENRFWFYIDLDLSVGFVI